MYSRPFLKADGTPLRPWSKAEEADEAMIQRWNSVISPRDKIYHLGDVALKTSSLEVLSRLNGRKILISGNHACANAKRLLNYFEDVRGAFFHHGDSAMRGGLIFTHIPVHPSCLSGHYLGNVHGHLHYNRVLDADGNVDQRYFNCCVELHNFTPVPFETVKEHFR